MDIEDINNRTATLIADLMCMNMLDNNSCIINTKHPASHEDMEVKIFIYTESDKQALRDVLDSIIVAEFDNAKAKMSTHKKNGIELIDWSILEARMARMEMLATEE